MSLARRIVIGVAAATLIPVLFATLVYLSLQKQAELRERVRSHHEALTSLSDLERLAVDMETGVRGFRAEGDEAFLEPYQATSLSRAAVARRLSEALTNDIDRRQFADIQEKLERWRLDWAEPRIAAIRAAPRVVGPAGVFLPALPERLDPRVGKVELDAIRSRVDRLTERLREQLARDLSAQAQAASRLSRELWFAAVSFSFLMAVGSAQLLGHFRSRLGALFTGIRSAEKGDYRPIGLSGTDEPARIGSAFDRMIAQVEKRDAELASIVENIPAMIFVKDADDLRFVRLNRSGEELLGMQRADLIGKSDFDLFPREEAELITSKDREVLSANVPLDIPEEEISVRNGEVRLLHTKKIPLSDGSGRPRYLLGISEDITDRRRAEEEIRSLNAELKGRLRELSAANRLVAFGADIGGALTHSDSLRDSLQHCAEAMVRHLDASIASLWVLDEKSQMLDLVGSAGFGATLPDFQTRVPVGRYRLGWIAQERKPQLVSLERDPARDDDKNWARNKGMVSFAGYPLLVRGRTVGVMAMFAAHELTEASLHALASVAERIALGIDRTQAVEALAANDARTRAIIDNMLGGLITTDGHAVIESANPAAEKLFLYAPGELIGKHLSVLMPIGEGEDPRTFLREATQKALGRVTEWKARRRDRSLFDMELALFPFATSDGWHFAGHVADISQRREVERMKKEFVSTVSHELRTPLTSIRGSLGLLAGGVMGDLPQEAQEILAVAERNVVRLVTLINDILDLERLDSGRLEMHFTRVPVAQIVERSIEAVKAFAEEHEVSIESMSTEGALFGDGDRLVQVLVNLLSNAVKFSDRGSTVSISVSEATGNTEIRVRDQGRGVPIAFQTAIFERFRQVEGSDAREKGGTGLGLAICKAIVEQHAGSIGVESEEGNGSVFWIRIPAPIPRIVPRGRADSSDLPRPDVLLVEDDPTLQDVLTRQLTAAGMDVRVASSGRAALALARERAPNMLILDIKVPEGDGFFIVEELRKNPIAPFPLLVYSERDVTGRERERLRLGATRFLTKSRSSDQQFLDAVLGMLSESQAKRV